MNTQETIFFEQHKTIIPYLEAYTSKIYENLCTIYGSKTSECFRFALKGQNSIKKQIKEKQKIEKGSLGGFLKTIKLNSIQYQSIIQINPNFNQVDYQIVMDKVCQNLFNSGYRIISGKSLQDFLDTLDDEELEFWPAPSLYNSEKDELPPDTTTKKYDNPETYFGFWEEIADGHYVSSDHYPVRFVLDRSKRKNVTFMLDIPYLSNQNIKSITVIKIEIPTFENKFSRQMLWRELSDNKVWMQLHPKRYPVANFLYNTVDTNKDNLKVLLQLLSVYHESLNIFTMQRLSGIPRMQVLLYEDGQRDSLVKKIVRWLYIKEELLLKLDTSQINHLAILIQKNYLTALKNEKFKIIISLHISSYLNNENIEEDCIDQIEMNLKLLFSADIYNYLIKFSEVYLLKNIIKFLGENIIIRRSFLIPKLCNKNYWLTLGFNYSQVYEYNIVSFDENGQHNITELLKILQDADFSEINECFNAKLVPAEKDDIKSDTDYIKNHFLISHNKEHIEIYVILLINHVQKLYRKPIRIIKMKTIDTLPPKNIDYVAYNTKSISISNQNPLLETVVESKDIPSLVESLLFIKSLNSDQIDYKIRQNIVQEVKYKKIDDIVTYNNLCVKSWDNLVQDIENIV